ncbi:hypothetical protein pb186bvf_010593 [Paramecium bursaria]
MNTDNQEKEYFLKLQNYFQESILYLDQKILKYTQQQEVIQEEIEDLRSKQKGILEKLLIDLYTNSCRCNYLQSHKINKKMVESSIKRKIATNQIELIKILQHREDWIEQLDFYCQIQNEKIQQKRIYDEAQYKELSQEFQNLSLKATKIVKLHEKFEGLRMTDQQQQLDTKKSIKQASKIQFKNIILNQDLDSDSCTDQLNKIQQQLKELKGFDVWSNISKEKREALLLELNKYQTYIEIKQSYLYFCQTELEVKFVFKFNSIKMINNYQNWFNNYQIMQTLEENLQICQGNILKIHQTKLQILQRLEDIEDILNDLQ